MREENEWIRKQRRTLSLSLSFSSSWNRFFEGEKKERERTGKRKDIHEVKGKKHKCITYTFLSPSPFHTLFSFSLILFPSITILYSFFPSSSPSREKEEREEDESCYFFDHSGYYSSPVLAKF